ncbi:ribonuclease-like protein p/mrp subunit [Cucurbitaria berberidis CBS 394.84]|uniref:Ribonuclease-like protein p/mrp subunit n=1 Tax=Cucurbitaria berberidis CBS 394.84 TaxID=1168544 RepID=A0A9P4GDP1_9PLEO|nr:ribonuclease-like protein p/mrp subunit [Cucurbitaria berberidis CBS 394.84]KAF1843675.1 ribonuclease-like protein p/mrp subunit [Cucurbitaria berberidis CBS 394.84]
MEESTGLVELFRGEDPIVDIVAVHGLNGHPFKTWTTNKTNRFWLKDSDLLPTHLKRARILTFGYNAAVASLLGKTSSDRILQHAQTLVAQLVADRELEDALQRLIIFICHLLGGIVVKRALAYSLSRTSKLVYYLHSIFVFIYGILFLGTLHNGSSKAGLALFSLIEPRNTDHHPYIIIVNTDSQLADALHQGLEVLQNITDMFAPLMKNFRIYFFWEQEKTNLGTTLAYIVEENSAAPILDDTERAGLPYGHADMAKFESRTSPGYRLVVAALLRYSREAPDVVSMRWIHAADMLKSKRQNEAAELVQ